MKTAISLFLLATSLAPLHFGDGLPSLQSIKRIHVGSMGNSDEAQRFRLLVEEALGKAGFDTTDDPKQADAILTGALSVRVYSDESRARATVVLKTPTGSRLWGKDFEPHFKLGGTRDVVKLRAEDVAKTLKKDGLVPIFDTSS